MKKISIIGVLMGAAMVCAIPISPNWSPDKGLSVSVNSAEARIGRPLTPGSIAGVNRRVHRRAYRRARMVLLATKLCDQRTSLLRGKPLSAGSVAIHKTRRAIMSRFLIAMFVGATIAAAASTSASAWHCLARSPNGATGTAFGVILERAQSISLRRCIHRGGGAACTIAWCRPY